MSLIWLTKITNGTGTPQSLGNFKWDYDEYRMDVTSATIIPSACELPPCSILVLSMVIDGRDEVLALFSIVKSPNGTVYFEPSCLSKGVLLKRTSKFSIRFDIMDSNLNVLTNVNYNAACVVQFVKTFQ